MKLDYLFQRVPESERPPDKSLEESLRFHGLTTKRLSLEVIRWLESVRLEDPRLYELVNYDPPVIKHRIKRYDFMFNLGYTTDFPRRRGWTDFMALREFVQNALDVEERIYGYDGIDVKVYQDEQGVHVLDRGPGITYESFRIGASDKAHYERGYFGEGLKIASAHFVGAGCTVYAFNKKGQVFKVMSPDGITSLVVMGEASQPPPPPYGTEVVICGARMAPELMNSMVFKKWVDYKGNAVVYTKHYGDPKKPSSIAIVPGEDVDILWVRDIVVNNVSRITGFKSIFGYNLWWVSLEPNRVMASVPSIAEQAAKAHCRETIRELLRRIIVREGASARVRTGYFETDVVDWWQCDESVKDEVAKYLSEMGIPVVYSERNLDWYEYLNVHPMVVPDRMIHLFSKAKTAEEAVHEQMRNTFERAEKSVVPREMLNLSELINLRMCEELMKAAHTHVKLGVFFEEVPELVVSEDIGDSVGLQHKDKVFVLRKYLKSFEATMTSVVHEYAHWHARKLGRESVDLTKGHITSMEEFMEGVFHMMAYAPGLIDVLNRIMNGGFGAKYLEWNPSVKYYCVVEDLYSRFSKELDRRGVSILFRVDVFSRYSYEYASMYRLINTFPPSFIAVPMKREVYVHELTFDAPPPIELMPRWLPPNRELYLKEVDKLLSEPRVSDRITGQAKSMGVDVVVFIYDPWEDKYVEHKVVKP